MSNKSPNQNHQPTSGDKVESIQDVNQPALSDDWQSLAADWQSQPYQKVDIDALVKQTQKRSLWAKLLLVIDIIAVVVLLGFLAYLIYQPKTDIAKISYVAAASVIYCIYLFFAIKVRVNSWKLMSSDPSSILQSAQIGIKSSLQYIKLLTISTWLFWPTFNIYIYVVAPTKEKDIFIPVLVANAIIIVSLITLKIFQNRRQRELEGFTNKSD